jgi:hypothetical protein
MLRDPLSQFFPLRKFFLLIRDIGNKLKTKALSLNLGEIEINDLDKEIEEHEKIRKAWG